MTDRILLLTTARTYRGPAFLAAADRLGLEIVQVVDTPAEIEIDAPDTLGVPFQDLARATAVLTDYSRNHPVKAILAVDDSGALLAAHASRALGLPFNSVDAAEAARDKYRMRQLLTAGGVPCPPFRRFTSDENPALVATQVSYPCVVKPLALSGSRGVIRANNRAELQTAVARTLALLKKIYGTAEPLPYLIEGYIPGVEVALEGMLDNGRLHVLALFDKPDPLEGPFFEETIYTTPSQLPPATQELIATATGRAAAALGLRNGPIHAELRINAAGAWLVELAGRSIGGLCSQTLSFGTDASLEELILRQAAGLDLGDLSPPTTARGVMMIPIPAAGLLRNVDGLDAATAVPHITRIEITAPLNHPLTPLPEGDAYLGFIFAEAAQPAVVETALRAAHAALSFQIDPVIALEPRASQPDGQLHATDQPT